MLLAEVGIIGLPTPARHLDLCASSARPKSDYPHHPGAQPGVVRRPSGWHGLCGYSRVDCRGRPGGLGHDFQRHIQRTRLLIHLVDASTEDDLSDFKVVQQELAAYGNGLDERPCLVALNKTELLLDEELEERIQLISDHCGQSVLDVAAATSKNLDQLLARVWKELGV